MNDQVKKTLAPFRQFWSDASRGLKTGIIVGLTVMIVAAAGISFFLNVKDYVVLFDRVNATETSEILAVIQQMNVDVKMDAQGNVMVPKSDESKVRMSLATAGYPKSGLSYYMIEQGSGLLTTDFERQQYVNMQLQERIGASIKTLDGVKDAIVTITVPDDSIFYLQEKELPTASVIIHMEAGNILSDGQVLGIQNLVVKSVSGLIKDNVAISDSGGNDLLGNGIGGGDLSKITVTRQIENDIKKKILSILEGIYGREKLRISVTAVVDTDELFTEEKLYMPSPDGNNSGVINQESRSEETSSSTHGDGGIPGTDTNAEVPSYPLDIYGGESNYSSETENTTYSVSQIVSQFQKDGAKIESVSIGIAIDKLAFETDEQERITNLVSYSVGVEPDNIAVESFRFFVPDLPDGPFEDLEVEGLAKYLIFIIAGGALLLLIILAVVILLLRKRKKKLQPAMVAAGDVNRDQALDDLFGEEIPTPIAPVTDQRREQIKEFADSNPEIAAQMIRSWLKSES